MNYFNENQLINRATTTYTDAANKKLIKEAAFAKITVFLSHSHKDAKIAEGFKNFLSELGLSLYIDWLDTDMPSNTNYETVLKIKRKIKENNYFILLATNNALNSKWVPWELGVADGYKNYENILIVPVADNYGKFEGNEYLQVYKRFELLTSGKLAIYKPDNRSFDFAETYLK